MENAAKQESWARGDWLQTYSGKCFFPLDPQPEDICIEDIAHALSLVCRFGGHVKSFYSVAQHSILVSRHCSPANKLWGLLHDASEAYLVDIPRPVKKTPELAGYAELEGKLMRVICDKFGLPHEEPAEVKELDTVLVITEQRDLLGAQAKPWSRHAIPLPQEIAPWAPFTAERIFLNEFYKLTDTRQKHVDAFEFISRISNPVAY
jgi:hypothetical protein